MTGPTGSTAARKRSSKAVSPTRRSGGTAKRPKRVSRLAIAETLEWPPLDKLWETIGDRASETFLKKQGSLEEYDQAVKLFVARLSLLVRGLYQDQSMIVFRASVPTWYTTADKADKVSMSESFEAAQTWVDSQLIGKMKAYARMWYNTPAGQKYRQDWQFAKRQKSANRYPYPRPPASTSDMIEFNQLDGLRWSKANVIDFWSAGLAAVETAYTSTGRLGWIRNDEDNTLFIALNNAALGLIRQYALMVVNMTDEDVFRVPVKDLMRSVQTFKFDEITNEIKERLIISPDRGDLFTASLNVHDKYDKYEASAMPDTPDGSSSTFSTPEPDTRACDEFVSTAVRNEGAYTAAVEHEERQYTHELALDTVNLMRDQEFAPTGYRLDILRPPPLKPEVADEIGLRYGRVPMKAKTKLHLDQMKIEIRRLNILVAQGCRRVSELEEEIKYIETLEAQRAEQIRILKGVHRRDRDLRQLIRARKADVEKPFELDQEKYDPDPEYEELSTYGGASKGEANGVTNQSFTGDAETVRHPNRYSGLAQTSGSVRPIGRAATPGRAPRSFSTPSRSRAVSVDPDTTLDDTQANEMYKEFVTSAVNID